MGTTQADKLHYITHFNFISFNFLVLFYASQKWITKDPNMIVSG